MCDCQLETTTYKIIFTCYLLDCYFRKAQSLLLLLLLLFLSYHTRSSTSMTSCCYQSRLSSQASNNHSITSMIVIHTCRLLTRVTIPANFPHCIVCSESNELPRHVFPGNGSGLLHRLTFSPITSRSGVRGVVGVPAGDAGMMAIGTGSATRGVTSGLAHNNVHRFLTILSFGQGVRFLQRPRS